ncbi:MAG: asparagine synthase (glutamine-hydrolyzing) [Planctomycetota bacterium]
MCGVIAALGGRASALRPRILAGVEGLRHRGPDGEGVWMEQCEESAVGLGHVRLATAALGDGAQPISNEDGSIVASCSGEIYGDAEMRADLIARGHRFRTSGDCELIVHMYEEHGAIETARRLRGEFAFVLWDDRKQTLFAARDRSGVRPLHFSEQAGEAEILVASEARGLFSMGVHPDWNIEALGVALTLQYPPASESLFHAVTPLAPGQVLVKRCGEPIRLVPYAEPHKAAASGIDTARTFTDAARSVRDTLDEAVRLRLRAEVPVAALLSGGLDSTAVAALARRHVTDLAAYTVRFTDSPAHDESAKAAASAVELGLEHRVVELDSYALLEALPAAVLQSEGISVNHHVAAKALLMKRLRRDGVVVALTGEGADEHFFGYAHLRGDVEAQGGDAASNQPLGRHAASSGLMLPSADGASHLGPISAVLGFTPTWLRAKAELGQRVHALLCPDVRAHIESSRPVERFAAGLADRWRSARNAGQDRATIAAGTWSEHALEGYILQTLSDRLELANGVEGRPAFLDPRVTALAASLPTRFKVRGGEGKSVLREALRGVVPDAVRTREKHPFLAPPPIGAHDFYTEQLDRDAFRPGGLFQRSEMERRLQHLESSNDAERAHWHAALMIAFSCAWLQDGLLSDRPILAAGRNDA